MRFSFRVITWIIIQEIYPKLQPELYEMLLTILLQGKVIIVTKSKYLPLTKNNAKIANTLKNDSFQNFPFSNNKKLQQHFIFRYDQPPKTPKNSERKTFSCPKCGKTFPILTLLQNHVNACLDQD